MASVKSRDTGAEMAVRKLVHNLGYRFVLGGRGLPGTPDLVFPSRKRVIFVHGCFWHGHGCARGARVPKTNRPYWLSKIARNRVRDMRVRRQMQRQGWKVAVIWECGIKDQARLERRLQRFFVS